VSRDEFRRVLEHVDEAVELAQDVVRDVSGRARLAVQIDRDLRVSEADLLDELAQIEHGRVDLGPGRELLVVDRQDERGRPRLLLRELREIAVARDAEYFHSLLLDGCGERADAESRRVLGAEVFVDDDDRKTKFHGGQCVRLADARIARDVLSGRQDGKARIMG
jgi:hypothetical protein